MSISISKIRPGDRVTFPFNGKHKTRTVHAVGDNYVTTMLAGGEVKVPVHRITSHTLSK